MNFPKTKEKMLLARRCFCSSHHYTTMQQRSVFSSWWTRTLSPSPLSSSSCDQKSRRRESLFFTSSSSSNELVVSEEDNNTNVREIIAPSASAFGANDGVVVIKPSRLDAFIAENLREEKITRGAVARSIANGNVFVNGTKTMKKTYKVQRGDVIRLTIERAKSLTAEPEDIKLDVIYKLMKIAM